MVREIPIAISACLLGEQVRYDGQHKLQDWITQMENVEWLPVPQLGARRRRFALGQQCRPSAALEGLIRCVAQGGPEQA